MGLHDCHLESTLSPLANWCTIKEIKAKGQKESSWENAGDSTEDKDREQVKIANTFQRAAWDWHSTFIICFYSDKTQRS